MKSKSNTLIAAMLTTALLFSTSVAHSQDNSEEGKAHFSSGVALFREGDYRGALVEFRRAHEILRNYRTLYNIGQTELELADYAAALRSFERYLHEGGSEIDAERRNAVRAEMRRLQTRVARIEIKSNAVGADVLLDDVLVGRTPLSEPVLVSAGRRKITVQKSDSVPVTRVVDVAGGDSTLVTLDVNAPKSAPSTSPTPRTPPPPDSHTGLWISIAATGALATGTIVTGVLALGARDDAEATLGRRGVTTDEVSDAHSKATTLGTVTDILGAASIVMGAVTVFVAVSGGKKQESAQLRIGPTGAGLAGRF